MGEGRRLVAWAAEMTTVHARLREALDVARDAATAGAPHDEGTRDLLLHCWGFCLALSGHHRSEDNVLFPALAGQVPALADTLRRLQQDHAMIEHLLGDYQAALADRADPARLLRHLDGIEAVMESHFGYEERQLLAVLQRLDLDADPRDALGPLA